MRLDDTNIRLDRCRPAPFYAPGHLRRRWIDQLIIALREAANLRDHYPFPPIAVCLSDDGHYDVIDGIHRVAALREFQVSNVPTRGWPPRGTITAILVKGPWQEAVTKHQQPPTSCRITSAE